MITLLACHFAAAVLVPLLSRRLGARVFLAAGLAPAATVVWAVWHAPGILAGAPVVETLLWAPDLGFEIQLLVDAFALLMIALVSGIGTLIFAYSRWYFPDRPDVGRLAALLVAFAGAMLGLVVADNLLALYLFWELTSITSYLLIGFEDRSAVARAAALRALLITTAGGLAMLGGFILLGEGAGTYALSEILAAVPTDTATHIALVLILFGAFTKSAQAPFHFWLPGAMAAPTPVSAYLHSATMVKAGVYLIARLAPVFAEVIWFWRPLVIGVGLATMIIGGWRALAQRDAKLLLAHGTTSQLGLLVVLLGAGYEKATLAGVTVLLAHGAFKAALFMVVGIVDHKAGTRDITRLSGLHRPLRLTFLVGVVAVASMAGLPPMLGFVAKEGAFDALAGALPAVWRGLILLPMVTGSALTFAYSSRFLWGVFASKRPDEVAEEGVVTTAKRPAWPFLAPAALLALVTVLFGVFPGALSELVVAGAWALDVRTPPYRLALWHGFNQALALSAAAVTGGLLLWRLRDRVGSFQQRYRIPLDGARLHDIGVAHLLHFADWVTGRMQTGSLPMYLLVILTTALVVPSLFLLTQADLRMDVTLVDRPMQLAVALVMMAATLVAIRTARRMAAVVAVGFVGYGVAFFFVIHGAPDLALTQLLIETLLLVLFVLVLRHLPPTFSGGAGIWEVPRVVVAVGTGVFMAAVALLAAGARRAPSISAEHLARSLPEADGRNVVNVILVDFRAFDTFGEIVVLTVAALGVMGLVRAARREREKDLAAERGPSLQYKPSPILDGAVALLFHTVLMFSLVLLVIGHDRPGGGFIGGLVGGSAFILVYLAGGDARVQRAEPLFAEALLGGGITLAGLIGAAAWLGGHEFLEAMILSLEVPWIGAVKLSSVFLFDVGVYLVVVGLVMGLLRSLGREEVRVS